MPFSTQKINGTLALLAAGMAAMPTGVFAENSTASMFNHFRPDWVIIAVLSFSTLLLLGFLLRLRQMCAAIARKASALEKSEKHIQTLGDNLPDEILFQLTCSPENKFSFNYITQGYKRVMGIERQRVLQDAKLAFDHIYEPDLPILQNAQRAAMKSLDAVALEIRVLDILGHLKWLRISAVPHRENGHLIWNGFMQDISVRKEIETSLVEEKHNFQNLFETIDDFLLVCDMNGHLLHANPAVERQLGYTLDLLRSMNLSELYPEKLRPEAHQVLALMRAQPSTESNLPLQNKDGKALAVEMKIFRGYWKNQKALFGVARDIGSRHQAETALRESQQMLRLIMNTIPISVFWKDKDSVYLGCNKGFMKECGLDRETDVIGKTPYDLFNQKTAVHMVESDQRVVVTNQPLFNDLHSFLRPDNSVGWRETSKIPLHDGSGRAVGVLEVWRDVTEQRHAEDHLKRTLEDMERFNQLMRGRERRTLELKSEINHLLEELGKPLKYKTTTDNMA